VASATDFLLKLPGVELLRSVRSSDPGVSIGGFCESISDVLVPTLALLVVATAAGAQQPPQAPEDPLARALFPRSW